MLDDFRIEWLCRRTCQMLNVDRLIFLDMLERNNGFNEDLIDTFLNMNTALHERSYALIFHREDSTREVWQMIETVDEEDLDEGFPPVAGAIQWARFLLTRIKLPMIKFRSVDQLLQSEQGTAAKHRFIEVGIILKEYEEEHYTKWLDSITKTLPLYLKQSLLIDAEQRPDLFLNNTTHQQLITNSPNYRLPLYVPKNEINHMSISVDPTRSIIDKLKLHKEKCHLFQYVFDPMGTKKKIEIKYLINYDPNLKESLIECYYLEKLGFMLPESIIQITLQYSKFEQLSNELRLMLENYHLTIASLDTIEVSLLKSYLDQIQRTIQPGASRISFGEIGTLDYVNECKKQLEQLHSILNQIRKISTDIREHLESFRFCVIDPIVPRHDDGTLFTCREYFEYLEVKRKDIISSLKRRYELIGPLLTKIESLVFGTNTGKHKNMRPFYTYWEHEVFTSLVELVIRNLCQFFENIFGTSSLFTADIILAPPRIKLQPPLEEIINSIRRSAYGISELPKHFTRWLHGTCISCPSPPILDEELESPDFTFNNDVKQHPDVISTLKPVRAYASGLVTAINRTLTQLLKYNDLWKNDKLKYTSQFALMSRTYYDYDEIMSIFSSANEIFDRCLHNKNLYSIQLSFKQFHQALTYHCKDWIHHYGQHLYIKMSNKLKEINEILNNLSQGLHHDADTVPDLKFVLNIIDEINQQQESIEHSINDIEQSYRILHQHDFECPQSEWVLIQTLSPQFVLSLIDDILQQIPPKKDLNLLKQKFNQRLTPLTIVLFQEIQRFNLLTSIMWKSMNELKQALNGQISFSVQLDEINKYLYHGQIPLLWRSYTPQTKKSLANWIEHFRRRNQQYEKWIQDGELKIVNLSGLHVPESYLAAIIQTAARKNQWPLDKATFYTSVTKWQNIDDVDESIQGICLLEGLYLEGAGWDKDNHCLIEQSNKQLIQIMPLMKIVPVETHRVNMNNHLATPVYVTSDRRNAMGVGFVFEASLYTKKDSSHWILNGVCLLLNTD